MKINFPLWNVHQGLLMWQGEEQFLHCDFFSYFTFIQNLSCQTSWLEMSFCHLSICTQKPVAMSSIRWAWIPRSIPNDIPQKTPVSVVSPLANPLAVPPSSDVRHGRFAVAFAHERAMTVGLPFLVDLAGVFTPVPGTAVFDFLHRRTAFAIDGPDVDDGDRSGPNINDSIRPRHFVAFEEICFDELVGCCFDWMTPCYRILWRQYFTTPSSWNEHATISSLFDSSYLDCSSPTSFLALGRSWKKKDLRRGVGGKKYLRRSEY